MEMYDVVSALEDDVVPRNTHHLSWIIDIHKFVLHTKQPCHMRSHRRRAVALACVVAAGDIGYAHFAGVMGLGLRDFAGDEHVGPSGNGGFKITLRAACAPRYFFNNFLRKVNVDDRAV